MRLICAALLLCACSAPPARSPGPAPGEGAPFPMIEPDSRLAALATDFNGSCAFARPGPEADRYTVSLQVTAASVIRDSAVFTGMENRIGTVAAGSQLAGEGPLSGGQGGGSGYGVVVRDSEGRVCRGYVSATDVSVLAGRSRRRP